MKRKIDVQPTPDPFTYRENISVHNSMTDNAKKKFLQH